MEVGALERVSEASFFCIVSLNVLASWSRTLSLFLAWASIYSRNTDINRKTNGERLLIQADMPLVKASFSIADALLTQDLRLSHSVIVGTLDSYLKNQLMADMAGIPMLHQMNQIPRRQMQHADKCKRPCQIRRPS